MKNPGKIRPLSQVCFTTPLKAPAMVKRTLQLETLRVREHSRAETQPDGSIVITSLPIVDVPGGDRFKTTAVTKIDPQPEGGCQARVAAAACLTICPGRLAKASTAVRIAACADSDVGMLRGGRAMGHGWHHRGADGEGGAADH